MSFLFPSRSSPAPQPAPKAPDRSSTEVQAAAEEQRRRLSSAGGRSSTVLTGGLGVPQSGTSAAVQLLGQAGKV
jgi:hypothetical protein